VRREPACAGSFYCFFLDTPSELSSRCGPFCVPHPFWTCVWSNCLPASPIFGPWVLFRQTLALCRFLARYPFGPPCRWEICVFLPPFRCSPFKSNFVSGSSPCPGLSPALWGSPPLQWSQLLVCSPTLFSVLLPGLGVFDQSFVETGTPASVPLRPWVLLYTPSGSLSYELPFSRGPFLDIQPLLVKLFQELPQAGL